MTLESTDKEAGANAKAPRVTLADIEGNIAERYDFTAGKAIRGLSPIAPSSEALDLLSICILTMKNGFTVVGTSAPASPENFKAELGQKLAYEDAVRQLWPLMGFALRDKLSSTAKVSVGHS